MRCPNCSSPVKPGDEFCENCGAILDSGGRSAGGSASASAAVGSAVAAPPRTGTKICPNCNHTNPASEDFCENCGAELSAAVALKPAPAASTPVAGSAPVSAPVVTGGVISCPHCNNLIAANDKFCRKCGYNFVTSPLSSTSRPTAQMDLSSPTLQQRLVIDVG